MFCKNCGTTIDERSGSCPKCGTAANVTLKPKSKKKMIIIISVAVAAVIVTAAVIAAVVIINEVNNYKKIMDAYENTLNAESLSVEIKASADEGEERIMDIKFDVCGKGKDTIIATYKYDDREKEYRNFIDNDYIYFYDSENREIEEKKSFDDSDEENRKFFDAVADRDMKKVYDLMGESLGFKNVLNMSYDELFDTCLGFVKDYYDESDTIDFDCDVKEREGKYSFEVNMRDFIDYAEDTKDFRLDDKWYRKIPEDAVLHIDLTIEDDFISSVIVDLETDNYSGFNASAKFSNINDIKADELKKYINN